MLVLYNNVKPLYNSKLWNILRSIINLRTKHINNQILYELTSKKIIPESLSKKTAWDAKLVELKSSPINLFFFLSGLSIIHSSTNGFFTSPSPCRLRLNQESDVNWSHQKWRHSYNYKCHLTRVLFIYFFIIWIFRRTREITAESSLLKHAQWNGFTSVQ